MPKTFSRALAEFIADPKGIKRELFMDAKARNAPASVWYEWNAIRETIHAHRPLGDYDDADTIENRISLIVS